MIADIDIINLGREALVVLIKVSLPILLISLGVGLAISLFQALTQIQENTLTFVPKVFAILISLFFLTPYMFGNIQELFENIIGLISAN